MLSYLEIQVVVCSILCLENSFGMRQLVFVIVLQLSDCGFFIFRNGGTGIRRCKEKHTTQHQIHLSIICFIICGINQITNFASLNLFFTFLKLFNAVEVYKSKTRILHLLTGLA